MGQPRRVSIESNIGSGKTNILNGLEINDMMKIPESRESWDPWIEDLFYKNKSRWCFATHTKILLDMSFVPTNALTERSPWSVHNVFIRRYYDLGYLTYDEYKLISQMYYTTGWVPDVIIYIKVPPKTCYVNICKKYGSIDDCPISLNDVCEFEKYYEESLKYTTQVVIRIDGRMPYEKIVATIQQKLNSILKKSVN